MFRRIVPAIVILAAAAAAFAAPVKATVASVADNAIVLKVDGEPAAWVKKGQAVRINKKFNGKITAVEGASVTLASPKAGEVKVGEAITFDKSLATGGC